MDPMPAASAAIRQPVPPLGPETLSWINRQVAELADDELRQQLKALMEVHYRLNGEV